MIVYSLNKSYARTAHMYVKKLNSAHMNVKKLNSTHMYVKKLNSAHMYVKKLLTCQIKKIANMQCACNG